MTPRVESEMQGVRESGAETTGWGWRWRGATLWTEDRASSNTVLLSDPKT